MNGVYTVKSDKTIKTRFLINLNIMKDKYGIELLLSEFYGKGVEKDYKFKQLKRNYKKGLYVVTTEWNIVRFEVIHINTKRGPILKDYYEFYPSDKYSGINKWRFDDHEEALNFYNNLEV